MWNLERKERKKIRNQYLMFIERLYKYVCIRASVIANFGGYICQLLHCGKKLPKCFLEETTSNDSLSQKCGCKIWRPPPNHNGRLYYHYQRTINSPCPTIVFKICYVLKRYIANMWYNSIIIRASPLKYHNTLYCTIYYVLHIIGI